jgi:8-oxo-dGTP pyrophosphatase MutT (NUDIX family)
MEPIEGWTAALQWGPPTEQDYVVPMSRESFGYWQMVRRKREAEVVPVIRRGNGLYLVHTKAFYPQGVYRLLTGGIKPGEPLLEALVREAREETSLDLRIERFFGALRYHFAWEGQSLPFASYLFAMVEEGGELRVGDPDEAISGFRELTLAQIASLADELEALPPDWIDWGRFRAIAHRFTADALGRAR